MYIFNMSQLDSSLILDLVVLFFIIFSFLGLNYITFFDFFNGWVFYIKYKWLRFILLIQSKIIFCLKGIR
jgi:hypothetical protein